MKTFVIKHECTNYMLKHSAPSVMAIGFFDGVHQGHQKVIRTAVEEAKKKGVKSAVMTFSPHPKVVLSDGKENVEMISTWSQKEQAIRELGVDYLFVVQFSKSFASIPPTQFVEDYIMKLRVQHVVVGFDFTYGAFGKGTIFTLHQDGRGQFDVTVIDKVKDDKKKISSTLIRETLNQGQVDIANHYLGRPFTTVGYVDNVSESRIRVNRCENMLPDSGMYEIIVKQDGWANYLLAVCNKEKQELTIIHYDQLPNLIPNDLVAIEWIKRATFMFKAVPKQVLTKV